jgi:hypothetical protein
LAALKNRGPMIIAKHGDEHQTGQHAGFSTLVTIDLLTS